MPAQLMGVADGSSILLDKPILLLGRDPECDILIESRKISRRHCCIAQVSNHLLIRDLASTNGVRVNGARVVEGALHHGDEVTIGNQTYRVVWDSVAPRPPDRARAVAAAGPAAPAKAATEIDDELLEACDEPVPLREPEALPPSLPSNILPFPPVRATEPAEERAPRVLPDPNDLVPSSDSPSRMPHPAPPPV